jgi:NADPH:quinone reductase-like Zn-dependent oxidoreductase
MICKDMPLPVPEPHMVLVKTAAISINPCDWKMPTKFPSPGAFIGCDFAGTVLAIGPEAAKLPLHLRVGDKVCGGIHGSNPIDHPSGSFSQYVAAHGDLLFRLPDSVPFQDGAVLGGSVIATLRLALASSLGLDRTPENPATGDQAAHVLVYGGSTSTGTMAIQILKLWVLPCYLNAM